MAEAIIALRNVTKTFPGGVKAVDDVSFDIDQNEFFALLGPSGCGKTTLLRMISGLETPTSGQIIIGGEDMALTPPNKRPTNMVFQSYAVFPHMTVADNVAYGLRVTGVPAEETKRRVGEALDMVKLTHLAARKPDQMSGGQRQRVALARALVKRPKVLLLDEPLSALDAPLRRQLREELRALVVGLRRTVVLVTHDLGEAYQLGDRLVLYEAGRIVQTGPKAEVLGRPASATVARLIGLRNVVRGTVVKTAPDRVEIAWRGHTVEAVNSPTSPFQAAPGTSVAFVVRPEHVRLIRKDRVSPDPGHHMNLLRGEIVDSIDHGTSWTLLFRIAEPGPPSQGAYDLEIEVPHLVYEILDIGRDREWEVSMHRGALQVLAGV